MDLILVSGMSCMGSMVDMEKASFGRFDWMYGVTIFTLAGRE